MPFREDIDALAARCASLEAERDAAIAREQALADEVARAEPASRPRAVDEHARRLRSLRIQIAIGWALLVVSLLGLFAICWIVDPRPRHRHR
jgi:anti-sigma factor RsiW